MISRSKCIYAVTLLLATTTCFVPQVAAAKVYDRCELARELLDLHELPKDQIGTWVCIARYESDYNTSAINKGSGDHGLFQISELFWCSPPGAACGVSCDSLEDDDIEDDVVCARRIFRQHQRLHGNGFLAWVVYNQHCRNAQGFVDDCWNKDVNNSLTKKEDTKDKDKDDAPKMKETVLLDKNKDSITEKIPNVPVVDIEDEVVKVDADECNDSNNGGTKSLRKDCKKPKQMEVNKARQVKISDNYEYINTPNGFKLVYKKSK